MPVFSHAVHSAAMALYMAEALGLSEEDKRKILDFNHVSAETVAQEERMRGLGTGRSDAVFFRDRSLGLVPFHTQISMTAWAMC